MAYIFSFLFYPVSECSMPNEEKRLQQLAHVGSIPQFCCPKYMDKKEQMSIPMLDRENN